MCQFTLEAGTNKGSLCSQKALVVKAVGGKYTGIYCSRHAKIMTKRETDVTDSTVQLKNENQSLILVRADLERQGYLNIRSVLPQENRMKSTTADFMATKDGQEYSISVKTSGGLMSKGNFGVGLKTQFSLLLKEAGLVDAVEQIRQAVETSNLRKQELSAKYERWQAVLETDAKKLWVCEPLLDCYKQLFSQLEVVQLWVDYIRSRQTDLLAIVKNGKIDYHYQRIVRSHSGLKVKAFGLEAVEKGVGAKEFKLTINDEVCLIMRFKSEGGKVGSSIKMNLEHKGHFI